MALDLTRLQEGFRALFGGESPLAATFEAAGATWASVYIGFATTAEAVAVRATTPTPASLHTARSQLGKDLATAFAAVTRAADLTPRVAKAFTDFWPDVAFHMLSESGDVLATGKATSPDSQKLLEDLNRLFDAVDLTAEPLEIARQQADGIASVLAAWTHTVTVVNVINGQSQPAVRLT